MRRLLFAMILFGSLGTRTYGHHSFAKFYFEDRTTTVEGTVVEFEYRNPHAWLYVEVAEQGGELQRFAAEWSNPARLGRQGVRKDTLKPGDHVVLRGSPGRDPEAQILHLKQIERPSDGFSWVSRRDDFRRRSRR